MSGLLVEPRRAAARILAVMSMALVMLMAAPSAHSIEPVFSDNDLAIRGYDPVAYFTAGEPTLGDPAFTHEFNGATWQFASAANRDAFVADPQAFAPQYGGYCSWAASRNYVASTNPKAWEIVDGKLYLNFSRSVHALWKVGKRKNIAKGDANWPGLLASQ